MNKRKLSGSVFGAGLRIILVAMAVSWLENGSVAWALPSFDVNNLPNQIGSNISTQSQRPGPGSGIPFGQNSNGSEGSVDGSEIGQELNRKKLARNENSRGADEEVENNNDVIDPAAINFGGGRRESVPYLNPIEGASGAMNNQEILRMVSSASSSKLGLYNIVTNLTEPGVSQGVNSTMAQTQGMWGNRIAAEGLFLDAIKNVPGGEDLTKARLSCISKKLQTTTIVDAVSACSGGSNIVNATSSAALSSVPGTVGNAPTLQEMDPNHARYKESGLAGQSLAFGDSPCQGADEICGTDYLFNQGIRRLYFSMFWAPEEAQSVINTETAVALETLRKEFLDFIGDIRFYSKFENGNTQTIESNIVPARIDGSGDVTVKNMQRARYEDFNALMLKYCEWSEQICSGATCGPGGGDQVSALNRAQYPTHDGDSGVKIRNFWRDAVDAKTLRARLSTSSFVLHPKIIEDLMSIYKTDSSFASRKDGRDAAGPCGGFYTGSNEPAEFNALYLTTVNGSSENLVNTNAAWHKPIYQMSRLIGEANYLDFIGTLGLRIQNSLISSAGLTSRVQFEMLNLLNTAGLKRSKTGSQTLVEEMSKQSMALQDIAVKMIREPAGSSRVRSILAQQSVLRSAGDNGTGRPNAAGNN